MSAVLVAGSTGTVGSQVVDQLAAAGVDVRAGTRRPEQAPDLPAGAVSVRFDLEDPDTWTAALDGVRRVFLLRPPDVARAERLQPLLDAMVTAGVEHVVLLSVQAAGRNPLLPHRALERRVEASGMAWTHLRPAYFLDNLLTVHRAEIRDHGELCVPAGNGRTAVVDVADLAAVAVRALTESGHERQAYELTADRAPSWPEVAAELTAVLGRPVTYPRPGIVAFLRQQRRWDRPVLLSVLMAVLYSGTRLGLAGRTTGDLTRLLGRPPTTVRQFLEAHADSWR